MTAATATGGRRRVSGLEKARRREAALQVMPSLIPILVLSVAPLIMGIALAFTDARLVRRPKYEFVGVDNFVDLFSNTMFWESFRIGMVWAVAVTVLQLLFALGLALLLNSDLKFQGLTRVLALIPWAMPPVVVAIMWQMIYAPNGGPLNAVLGAIGLPSDTNWLANFTTARAGLRARALPAAQRRPRPRLPPAHRRQGHHPQDPDARDHRQPGTVLRRRRQDRRHDGGR